MAADGPVVDQVLHPALPCHPEHHLWQRDFTGSSGLFSFTFKKDYTDPQLAAFIDSLELFHLGYSWGGYKSLLTAAKVMRSMPSRYAGKTLVRLSIGLEDCDDLIHDLEIGLSPCLPKGHMVSTGYNLFMNKSIPENIVIEPLQQRSLSPAAHRAQTKNVSRHCPVPMEVPEGPC